MGATIRTQNGIYLGLKQASAVHVADAMQDRVDEPPIVRCPGRHQSMEATERTSVTERLVDIRYVCAACGMEMKRTVADETP